jgi:NAD(P)-dependent dehydrogenase (short-subunit alcohol dehydrogenase family)
LLQSTVVVTGGSRGLGLGLVEALVAQEAKVTAIARGVEALEAVQGPTRGVATICAGVTQEGAAHRSLPLRDTAHLPVPPSDSRTPGALRVYQ